MEAGFLLGWVKSWLAAGLDISHTVQKTEDSVQLYTETRGRASVDSQWPLSLVPKSLSVRWDGEGGTGPPFCVAFPSRVWKALYIGGGGSSSPPCLRAGASEGEGRVPEELCGGRFLQNRGSPQVALR